MRPVLLVLTCLLATVPAGAQFVAPGGVIPVVASLPGLNETFWRSDVSVLNVTAESTQVVLQLYPEIVGGVQAFEPMTTEAISIPANGQLTLTNVVQSRFQLTNVKGALSVLSLDGTALVVTSRTFTVDTSGGSFGQDVTSVLVADTAWAGGLRHDGFYRTNLGIFWPWDLPAGETARFDVSIHDQSGAEVAAGAVTFTEAGLQQLSLSSFGVQTLVDGYAVITCTDPAAVWYGYASRVDQITGDAVFRPVRGYQSALP